MIVDPVSEYARDVVAGVVIAGPHVRAACVRHLDDIKNGAARGLYFDYGAVLYVLSFFEDELRLSEGQFEGIPFKLHPSQKFIIGSIFGWKWKATGFRRFRRAYIEMGKGNGKSPLAGGIGLFGMLDDNEPGAQIYSAGATREQSDILFQDAVKMAKASRNINEIMDYSGNAKVWNMFCMEPKQAGSFFRPLARTAGKSGSGPRPHFALCDELHEHPSRDVLDLLERGFKFRRQPLLLMITNSGSDRKSLCWEEHEHAVKVAARDIEDDTTFSYVCALDDDDDPLEDPSCWIKANPLLGVILTHEYIAGVVAQARAIPGKQNGILRLHFCVWTDAETAWISRQAWEAIEDPKMSITDFIGVRCWAGLDLSSRKDLTAKALVFEDGWVDGENGEQLPCYAAFVHGYTPKGTLKQRQITDKAPYDIWVKRGFITATPGPVVRFPFVITDLVADADNFDLVAVAYDRHLITRFEEDMQEMGADLPLIEHPQGWNKRRQDKELAEITDTEAKRPLWMPGSVDLFEDLVLERRLRVHVNPALRSAVAGAVFQESPAGLKRFAKNEATQRIDMAVALAMAIGAAYTEIDDGGTIHEELGRRNRENAEADEPTEMADFE